MHRNYSVSAATDDSPLLDDPFLRNLTDPEKLRAIELFRKAANLAGTKPANVVAIVKIRIASTACRQLKSLRGGGFVPLEAWLQISLRSSRSTALGFARRIIEAVASGRVMQ